MKRVESADADAWRDLTSQFVERVKDMDPNAHVWADRAENFLTLVTDHDELAHELALHAVWVDLCRGRSRAATGSLVVLNTAEAADHADPVEQLI